MATKQKTTKRSKGLNKTSSAIDLQEEKTQFSCEPVSDSGEAMKKKKLGFLPVVIIVIVIGVATYLLKDKFLVAIVNNKPVFGFMLNQRLIKTYGKETLENIIVERLIKEEAGKKGVTVSEDDVKTEIDKVTRSLGAGITIEDALKYQGIALDDFKQQLRIRLQVNKILEKGINITSEELDKFIKDNGKLLTASGEAERKLEAEAKLKDQKISEKIQTWVSELIAKAKITRYLK